jgi:hypothetical protein
MIVKFIKENSVMVLIAVSIIIILVATVMKNNDYENEDTKNMNNWYPYNGWGNNPYLKCQKNKKYPYNTECKYLPIPTEPIFVLHDPNVHSV